MQPHSLVALVTLAALLLYFWFSATVARVRHKTGVHAPAMTANLHVRTHTDTVVTALPCAHVYGNVVMNGAFLYGMTLVLLERFGLADKRGEYPDRLSGGQQQRVAIVRALAMRPELMLLDEVTSALDPELVAEVLSVIRELADSGMTMVIATHEMSFARDTANRVCFLDAGRILEQGPAEEIFTRPREPRTQQFLERIIAAGRL